MRPLARLLIFSCLITHVYAADPNNPNPESSQAALNRIEIDHLEKSSIYFKTPMIGIEAPKPIETGLFEMTHIGTIHASNGSPYFLLKARPCENCIQDFFLYFFQTSHSKPEAFTYPGRIIDAKTRTVVMESRAFIGKCVRHTSDEVLVIFQKEKVDRKRGLLSSVYIATPGMDHISGKLIERHMPKIQETLRLTKSKNCREIEGKNRLMLSNPITTEDDMSDEDSEDRPKGEL